MDEDKKYDDEAAEVDEEREDDASEGSEHSEEDLISSSVSSEASGNEIVEEASVDVLADESVPIKVKEGFGIAYQVASYARHVFKLADPDHFMC